MGYCSAPLPSDRHPMQNLTHTFAHPSISPQVHHGPNARETSFVTANGTTRARGPGSRDVTKRALPVPPKSRPRRQPRSLSALHCRDPTTGFVPRLLCSHPRHATTPHATLAPLPASAQPAPAISRTSQGHKGQSTCPH
jgi:hypothetical protein